MKDKIEIDLDSSQCILEICRIYIKLEQSDEFCSAVSKKEHFYSPELFEDTRKKALKGKEINKKKKLKATNDNFIYFI